MLRRLLRLVGDVHGSAQHTAAASTAAAVAVANSHNVAVAAYFSVRHDVLSAASNEAQ